VSPLSTFSTQIRSSSFVIGCQTFILAIGYKSKRKISDLRFRI
jgi:hypothetical protein